MTVVVWRQLEGGLFDLYEIVPGIVLSLAAIVAGSLADPPPPREVRDEFDQVGRRLNDS